MRSIISGLLLACTAAVLLQWTFEMADACDVCLFPSALARGAAIEDLARVHDQFAARLDAIASEMSHGQISLAEATQQVQSAASALNPGYLLAVDGAEPDGDIQLKVAHRMLMQLDPSAAAGVGIPRMDPSVYRELQNQYVQMASRWKRAS